MRGGEASYAHQTRYPERSIGESQRDRQEDCLGAAGKGNRRSQVHSKRGGNKISMKCSENLKGKLALPTLGNNHDSYHYKPI